MDSKAFENVKNQIGYCGIWCGSCIAGNGALRELTRRYAESVEKYGLKEWAPKDFDFAEFEKGLSSIQGMPLCPGCLKGGGKENCEMKTCACGKKISDCSRCDDPGACQYVEVLKKMRDGATEAGLFVKTEKGDNQELISAWTEHMKVKWPSIVLFLND